MGQYNKNALLCWNINISQTWLTEKFKKQHNSSKKKKKKYAPAEWRSNLHRAWTDG
jgi:hypothetical protein